MQCILGVVGSFNHGLNITLRCLDRRQSMAEYLFSRVIPRQNLGWSQVERLARLDSYGQHQAVWELFDLPPDTAGRGGAFLFRQEWHSDLPAFYVLSLQAPQDRTGLWDIQSKRYAPQIEDGDPLYFKLRVNPVVTHNGKRHDVVMDAKQRLGWKELPPVERPALSALAYEAGTAWLMGRAEKHGFSFASTSLMVDGYRTHAVHGRGRTRIRFSTLDFSGVLTVVNAEQFLQTLYCGIGPAKGFGCGLLLVKRVALETF
jgi:CRISPR system Cascade subunit CasE